MAINQITVFLENKAGTLLNITKILACNDVNLCAINIAETSDYGLVRLITADNEKAKSVLTNAGYVYTETPVLAIVIGDKIGSLNGVLEILAKEDINVKYMYSIMGGYNDRACMVLQLSDIEKAIDVLKKSNVEIADESVFCVG